MNYKKLGIILFSILFGVYALFLIFPFVISPLVNNYTKDVEKLIKDSTGIEVQISNLALTTSLNLAVGVKTDKLTASIPNENSPFFTAEKAGINLKLIPLIFKKVEFGKISAQNLDGSFAVKRDGAFVIQDYLLTNQKEETSSMSLPYGLKLSNRLPDFVIMNYKFTFIDTQEDKSYYIQGKNFKINDFILDKKIKISTSGKIVFDNEVISNYNVKIFNKIMPKLIFDDIVFPKQPVVISQNNDSMPTKTNKSDYTIIDIFKLIKRNQMHLNLDTDIRVSGSFKSPVQKGYFNLSKITVAVNGNKLPESYANLKFKGKSTVVDSIFFSSADKNEKTQLIGTIKSGKKPSIDLTFRSNAKFNNIIRLIDSVCQTFGVNDLKTVSATGSIDANFNIRSNLKKMFSSGYFKINQSSLTYGLYNIFIDKISADIDMRNNNINIKHLGFSILNHPLNLLGSISSDAFADLKLSADKLSIKGLLGALGQISILKDNQINSGVVSFNAIIKGKLSKIKPNITLSIDGVDIYNKPMAAKVLLVNSFVKLLIDNDKINGDIGIKNLSFKINGASVSIPNADITADTRDINIKNSSVLINNSKIALAGLVKDYNSSKMNMNIKASGNLASADVIAFIPKEFHSMFPYKGAMPIELKAVGDAQVQDISLKIIANPANYIRFADINLLRNKTTNIYADMKISSNSLTFSNSGIYEGQNPIAKLSGGINNLSNPSLNINIDVPNNISFPIWGLKSSNLTANGGVNISGAIDNPKIKGIINIPDISIKDMNFVLQDLILHLNGSGICGNATAKSIKMDNLKAADLNSKFALTKFNNFYLSDISGNAFNGTINGLLSYNISSTAINLDFKGKGLNSTDAVYAFSGIPKALTGSLDFDAKLNSYGVTDIALIKNMKGKINFHINDGRFLSIGKLENLVQAQNIVSNSLLKSAVSALSTFSTVHNTDKFETIKGEMNLLNGVAELPFISVAGPMMSYYIKGNYNILKNSAYLLILGRLDSKTVGALGPFGQLSADKVLGLIPKFGAQTAQFLNLITQDPENENVSLIPALTSGSSSYSEFKVIFNGYVNKVSSIKSFKWLSKGEIEKSNIKQDIKDAKDAVKNNINSQINSAKNTVETVKTNVNNAVNTTKQNIQNEKQSARQTVEDIKNIKENAGQGAVNLGKLLFNAASNANKKIDTSKQKSIESVTEENNGN
ncbi:hypothetical protein J6G99_02140 [bacterium]|nr:hypothetical protein [bacterium]